MSEPDKHKREQLLVILSATTFVIFLQAYMVAPLLPRLATIFDVSVERIGLVVPAYLIPYGLATLVYGVLSDRVGRRPILITSLVSFVVLTLATGFAQSANQLTVLRLVTGLGASGVVPLSLVLIADLFSFAERGRPLGWLFGAMAGGMAVGSTAGVILEPIITWRWLFFGAAIAGGVCLLGLVPYRALLLPRPASRAATIPAIARNYLQLLGTARGIRTYLFVFFNAVFHSGIFTWLGLYFSQRYGLSEMGIGLALLGYGIPGFLLGPVIGRWADRFGRSRLIPLGLLIAGTSAAALAAKIPLLAAAQLVTLLSLGYDLTQPLLATIVTDLGPQRGQAMGLNVFALFSGLGVGSLLFATVMRLGLSTALLGFGLGAMAAGVAGFYLFRSETAVAA